MSCGRVLTIFEDLLALEERERMKMEKQKAKEERRKARRKKDLTKSLQGRVYTLLEQQLLLQQLYHCTLYAWCTNVSKCDWLRLLHSTHHTHILFIVVQKSGRHITGLPQGRVEWTHQVHVYSRSELPANLRIFSYLKYIAVCHVHSSACFTDASDYLIGTCICLHPRACNWVQCSKCNYGFTVFVLAFLLKELNRTLFSFIVAWTQAVRS